MFGFLSQTELNSNLILLLIGMFLIKPLKLCNSSLFHLQNDTPEQSCLIYGYDYDKIYEVFYVMPLL